MPLIKTSRFVTIDRFISEEESMHPGATGVFTSILHDLSFAFRIIQREVRRAGLNDILGLTDSINVHGETVRRLDEYANEVIIRSMDHGGHLCVMASEEEKEIIRIPEKFKKGKYILVFDPLDGSSNIDVNITIGTIFSLYKRINPVAMGDGTVADVLQPGIKQVAAGYTLYGSSTLLCYTTGNGVNIFTYDPTLGEFLLTFENVRMPESGQYFSCNMGNYYNWEPPVREFVRRLQTGENQSGRIYSQRYVGSGVADIHRTMHYGGIYIYPADSKMKEGKFRLVYEANALSMIAEQAGGIASDGHMRILEKKPERIHQRTPLIIGSRREMNELLELMKGGQ
ncbi:MAG: class 1 fructose-bisphosphatase [Candidatus Kapaibacterium sp.]